MVEFETRDSLAAAQATSADPVVVGARRLLAEVMGTFMLVTVAAGAGMVDQRYPGQISDTGAVVAPGLMVMAIILFSGHVSGAHLNPVVSLAFALRADFPWRRVPGYLLAQFAGALLAAWLLTALVGVPASAGMTEPGDLTSTMQAVAAEALLTFGLVSVILGTASGFQNVGPIGAIAVGGYIALAGLWSDPLSGASMNPARSLGPAAVAGDLDGQWIYLLGPTLGALLACAIGLLLRGSGGGRSSSRAAQGDLRPEVANPTQP